jgi:hypothetical protein
VSWRKTVIILLGFKFQKRVLLSFKLSFELIKCFLVLGFDIELFVVAFGQNKPMLISDFFDLQGVVFCLLIKGMLPFCFNFLALFLEFFGVVS